MSFMVFKLGSCLGIFPDSRQQNWLHNPLYLRPTMKIYVPALLVVLFATGCASITKGTSQTLVFNLDPQETRCTLSRDGDGEIGSINARNNTVTVGKDKDDILVKCQAEGHAQKITRLVSSADTAGVVGGVFIDLGITDMVTGAMWQYPNTTTITLEKESAQEKRTETTSIR